ncbi:unnamed protein product, partial [Allacma fusca]
MCRREYIRTRIFENVFVKIIRLALLSLLTMNTQRKGFTGQKPRLQLVLETIRRSSHPSSLQKPSSCYYYTQVPGKTFRNPGCKYDPEMPRGTVRNVFLSPRWKLTKTSADNVPFYNLAGLAKRGKP